MTLEPNEIWHRMLAHVHYRALPLARKAVEGLPKIQAKHVGVYKGCAKGKNTKKTFRSSESKEKRILEIIHFNVCSPMSSSSLSRYVYYVSFIDNFSKNTWIYFMKNKDKFFSKFKGFKTLIKNHTKKKIKTFRSDNGREFTSNEFKELCKDSGIKRELSTPYNPQQNGIAEQNNRTIMEAARDMLHDQDLPMHLWAEAARTVVYVQNRTPHRVLEKKTPEEVFSGKKPEVIHLRVFRLSH